MSANEKVTAVRVKQLLESFVSRSSAFETSKDTSDNNNAEESTPDSRNLKLFMERVESFSTLNWLAKPDELSPLVCARYGWMIKDKDLLQCVRCKAFLSGQLPKVVDNDVYSNQYSKITSLFKDPKSCKKLEDGLREAHEKFCPWPSNPSPASFAEIPLYNKDILIEDFKIRMTSLGALCEQIPKTDPDCFEDWNIKDLSYEPLVSYVKKSMDITDTEDDSLFERITWLSACGWASYEDSKNTIMCPVCRRQIGLWNYTGTVCLHASDSEENIVDSSSTEKNEDITNSQNDSFHEPKRKRRKLEKKEYFNPLTEHRNWCPWIKIPSGLGQITNEEISPKRKEDCPDKGEPTWLLSAKILIAHLPPESKGSPLSRKLKNSPPIEGLRHIRRMLRDWSSPLKPSE